MPQKGFLKTFSIFLFAVTIMLFSTSTFVFAQGDIISAKEFQLLGPDGKMTLQIGTSKEGTPSIWFYDKNDNVKLNLGLYPEGTPGIIFYDNNNQVSSLWRLADANGHPIIIFKENGQEKMIVGLFERSVVHPAGDYNTSINAVSPKNYSLFDYSALITVGLIGGLIGGLISRFGNKTII